MAEASEAAYSRHGDRVRQRFILRRGWAEDGVALGEIARRPALSTPTVTNSANRMQATGLVERRPHPTDATGLVERRPHPTDARRVRLFLPRWGREPEQATDRELRVLTERALATMTELDRATLVAVLT